MKVCNCCKIEKTNEAFYKKRTAKDGLFWWCRDCHKLKMLEKYRVLSVNSQYREKENARIKNFWQKNSARDMAYRSAYAASHRPEALARNKRWRTNNQAAVQAESVKRIAGKLQRTPCWLDEDDFWMITQAYELASLRTKMFGFSWQVDHIIPLRGKVVSGLHMPTNLQVITAVENRRKSNKFTVT